MNITITPNTTAIDATVLTPVDKSFASGGGAGGGGAINLVAGGVAQMFSLYNGGGTMAPGAGPTVIASSAETLRGGAALAGFLTAIIQVGASPYVGQNYHLGGSLSILVDYGGGVTDSIVHTLIGTSVPVGSLFFQTFNGPSVAGPQTIKLSFTNNLAWILDDAPGGSTPTQLIFSDTRLTIMEI